jgi:hypothetical protein
MYLKIYVQWRNFACRNASEFIGIILYFLTDWANPEMTQLPHTQTLLGLFHPRPLILLIMMHIS